MFTDDAQCISDLLDISNYIKDSISLFIATIFCGCKISLDGLRTNVQADTPRTNRAISGYLSKYA